MLTDLKTGVTIVTDGYLPATFTMTMAEMAELVPIGLRYGVHTSAVTSRHQETPH